MPWPRCAWPRAAVSPTTGVQVKGMPLDDTTMSIYARFGLSLAHTGQCGEALQISQALIQAFPDDETNLINAQEMVNVCKEQANGPAAHAGPGHP